MPSVVLFKSESNGPDKFRSALENAGFSVHSINCLEFRFKNAESLKEKLMHPEKYEGIIFTSQRAVEGTSHAIDNEPKRILNWIGKNNFCVGESTSELCKSLLKLDPEGKDTGNAQNLAALIIGRCTNTLGQRKVFLFPSGNLKQDVLETSLLKYQIELEVVELYETVVHSMLDVSIAALNHVKINYIVFFSPSGVNFVHRFLVDSNLDLEHTKIVAIGPATRKALEDLNLNCHFMCTKPTPESLLETLA